MAAAAAAAEAAAAAAVAAVVAAAFFLRFSTVLFSTPQQPYIISTLGNLVICS